MIFSKLSVGGIALLLSVHGAVAAPALEDGSVAVRTVPDYSILDIIPHGDLNITLYGIPDEKPYDGPQDINKRCGSNQLHCDSTDRNLAPFSNCLALINSLRDPRFANNVIPNGLRSTCSGKGLQGTCCISFTQNLSGTGATWSDLVAGASLVYNNCPRFDGNWVSGWTTDTNLAGQCGNQCLSNAYF